MKRFSLNRHSQPILRDDYNSAEVLLKASVKYGCKVWLQQFFLSLLKLIQHSWMMKAQMMHWNGKFSSWFSVQRRNIPVSSPRIFSWQPTERVTEEEINDEAYPAHKANDIYFLLILHHHQTLFLKTGQSPSDLKLEKGKCFSKNS